MAAIENQGHVLCIVSEDVGASMAWGGFTYNYIIITYDNSGKHVIGFQRLNVLWLFMEKNYICNRI